MTRTMTVQEFPETLERDELLSMLAMRRPAWSKTERSFIKRFIIPLGVEQDAYGNLYKRIGDAPVLWSSHTDTVHIQGGTQKLRIVADIITQADANSNCLGADCTAGVWLMIEMIRANRPGLYVFHRAEEIGGKGSEFIATHTPELLSGIQYAIAFDRRGQSSVITHQWGGRCCSEAFAAYLSAALGMHHKADSTGSFTDTANYTDLIGECSNLSVGYMNEHTKRETLDLDYLQSLRDALVRLDANDLIAERKPGDPDDDYADIWWLQDNQEPLERTSSTVLDLVRDHPHEIADWLEEYGINADEIATAIYVRGGVIRR